MLREMRVLIVEDDEPKLTAIFEFFSSTWRTSTLVRARSLSSGMSALDGNAFDLAILDMSLPTYDLAKDKAGGGEPQGFGGRDLLRLIEAEAPDTKAIVITQYPNFEGTSLSATKSLEELGFELQAEFGDLFLGIIFYSGKQGRWRGELRALIETLEQ